MEQRSLFRAKYGDVVHTDDSERKLASASAEIERAAERWLAEPYARLESQNQRELAAKRRSEY